MTHANQPATRTDAEIFAEARHALDSRPTIPATVRVHIDLGVATLTGTVRRPSERSDAADAVRAVPGVRRLINEITIGELISREGFEPPQE